MRSALQRLEQEGRLIRHVGRGTFVRGASSDAPTAARIEVAAGIDRLLEIENARPETKAIGENFERLREEFPFDPLEFIKFNMPDALKVTQRVDAVD